MITGAIIGAVLGLLVLVVVIYYLMRFLVARRVFNLSVRSVSLCPGLGPNLELVLYGLAVTRWYFSELIEQIERDNESAES